MNKPSAGRTDRLQPYTLLSRYYDETYSVWRAFLSAARDEIFRVHGVTYREVLDVGAGSGWQSLELARQGARVLAIEPERSFLAPLRSAARSEGLSLEVRQGALPLSLNLPDNARFDIALATFDVLNHLARREDLAPALSSLRAALKPGGHLFFDVNTSETIELFPEHHRVTRLSGNVISVETGSYDPRTHRGAILRDWFVPEGRRKTYRRYTERYIETAWESREIRTALKDAGLVVRLDNDACGWMSFSPKGARRIYLARRPSPARASSAAGR